MFSLHIAALLFSLVIIFIADKDALGWVRGKKEVMNESRLRMLHGLTWLGLVTLILSGSFLAYPQIGYLLAQPLFIMKMLFVLLLIVNAVLIGKLSHISTTHSFAQVSHEERMRLITSGAISFFSWAGALILALVFFK